MPTNIPSAYTASRHEQHVEEECDPDAQILEQIDAAIDACRLLYCHPLINTFTREAYDTMFEELRQKRQLREMVENIGFLQQTREKVQRDEVQFRSHVERALTCGWINNAVQHEWEKMFYNDAQLECLRVLWLQRTLPKLTEHLKETAQEQVHLQRMARKARLNDYTTPLLLDLQDDVFLSIADPEKRWSLLHRAEAQIMASIRDMEEFRSHLEATLLAASSGDDRILPYSEAMSLLRTTLREDNPYAYEKYVVLPRLGEARALRSAFDTASRSISLDHFLRMSAEQRSTYLDEETYRATQHKKKETEHAASLAHIRTSLDLQDWDRASGLLEPALEHTPKDPELLHLQRFIASHRTDKQQASVQTALRETRGLLFSLPTSIQTLYFAAALSGPDHYCRLAHHMRLRSIYAKQGKEEEQSWRMSTDPSAQVDFYRHNIEKIEEDKTKDPPAIVVEGLSKDDQEHITREIDPPILQNLRFLDASGYRFTVTGSPLLATV